MASTTACCSRSASRVQTLRVVLATGRPPGVAFSLENGDQFRNRIGGETGGRRPGRRGSVGGGDGDVEDSIGGNVDLTVPNMAG